jgi:hypothetical protein
LHTILKEKLPQNLIDGIADQYGQRDAVETHFLPKLSLGG